jgi:hypothetical protein
MKNAFIAFLDRQGNLSDGLILAGHLVPDWG